MKWTITTRMPSTGNIINQTEKEGTDQEYRECIERWKGEEAVTVTEGWASEEKKA